MAKKVAPAKGPAKTQEKELGRAAGREKLKQILAERDARRNSPARREAEERARERAWIKLDGALDEWLRTLPQLPPERMVERSRTWLVVAGGLQAMNGDREAMKLMHNAVAGFYKSKPDAVATIHLRDLARVVGNVVDQRGALRAGASVVDLVFVLRERYGYLAQPRDLNAWIGREKNALHVLKQILKTYDDDYRDWKLDPLYTKLWNTLPDLRPNDES